MDEKEQNFSEELIMYRDYQKELIDKILSLDDSKNPLVQADTGAGKTMIIVGIAENRKNTIIVAHRNILIKQISLALARSGINHQVIAAEHTRRQCILEHRKTVKNYMLDSKSHIFVASVDSLSSRFRMSVLNIDLSKNWTIIIDEAHHAVSGNKWGKLSEIFPNAQIIGLTATPCRMDQKSLSKESGGIFDLIVQAEKLKRDSVKKLIQQGYLSDFKIYASQDPGDYSMVPQKGDDYDQVRLANEMKGRVVQLSGDAIAHYKKHADGKQALCFCVSIDFSNEMAGAFKKAGYSSACINSKMSATDVSRIFELFRLKQIQILTHVDMIGEGVDVPSIEALIMLRPTNSFANYRQWIGRSLRPEANKDHAIILDHVGNVQKHGLPDRHVEWGLDSSGIQTKNNLIPCPKCGFIQNAWNTSCIECNANITKGHILNPVYCSFIDKELVLLKRKEIEKKELLNKEIFIPDILGTSSTLTEAIKIVREWFVNQIKDSISIYDMNKFLSSMEVMNYQFWVNNFTLAEINKDNKSKCLKIFKRWKKKNADNSK